ncbi:hypothetical protein IAQ61_003280 [Plenodomus lingam]|uniref:rhamnogalacturonan endolyase n=1 Tax=Leptosphaeria maculans (strain JN3 / isolate v23.1.3 / race Av1-4-5-6-7-8) TaxID=985895 RepID=E5AE11_LEPMJ|nr:similar to rhamnogalacturonase B precursor [Plenodomus lingam JN3]KAH9875815.1 hypothetical protein IAQ61_003280 [Plenodomus lingam]CBY01450.1 similar to rhamnogalacturonase B precursor [Plenodomus lingam JN3]
MRYFAVLASLFCLLSVAFAAWGHTDDGSNYVIDTNANLVVKVSKENGDMTSIVYRGVEYNGQNGKNSQVENGLPGATVSIKNEGSNVIKVTAELGTLTHSLVFRNGNPNVYIFINKVDLSIPASRYTVRIPPGIFKRDGQADWAPEIAVAGEWGDIESYSGLTWSKHYTGRNYGRTMDYDYIGYQNANVGMYLIRSNREKSSGGPFFRSMLRRGGPDGNDLYEIFSTTQGHTEILRLGLHGPSVLAFTDNGAPPNKYLFARNAELGWVDSINIKGWVPASRRGSIYSGGVDNKKSEYKYTIGLKNKQAQYWADGNNGIWRINGVLPGTYVLTAYKNELEVAVSTVIVYPGETATPKMLVPVDPSDENPLWRIGDWDGTPQGLLNFEDTPMKPTYMHPSDYRRLHKWDQGIYRVGISNSSLFPGYLWRDINDDRRIIFLMEEKQRLHGMTIRLGVTQGQAGGRPQVSLNGKICPLNNVRPQSRNRTLTIGNYRGNNHMYEFEILASQYTADFVQEMRIEVVSDDPVIIDENGARHKGHGYLSPGFSIDCIDAILSLLYS